MCKDNDFDFSYFIEEDTDEELFRLRKQVSEQAKEIRKLKKDVAWRDRKIETRDTIIKIWRKKFIESDQRFAFKEGEIADLKQKVWDLKQLVIGLVDN